MEPGDGEPGRIAALAAQIAQRGAGGRTGDRGVGLAVGRSGAGVVSAGAGVEVTARPTAARAGGAGFIHDLDGKQYDGWYQLPSASDVDQVMKKTVNDLGGLVFDLRFRN
ncbi:hypothetical protein AB0M45_16535 [Nocardia sp. NPDC051787]|uniref:hypothetical protein n=1 Tax=Nocardia sp. NPDC051787 TaxID=3155415 RepID=UPI00341B399B